MADKLEMATKDVIDKNVDIIASIFPNVIREVKDNGKIVRKIDFDILRQELSTVLVEGKQERYQLTWPDKKKAILLTNSRINETLRPVKDKSIDFENTKNIYIEGDNLDVLKVIRETYLNSIKLIYIDPPYNTGNDFVYSDNFTQSTDDYIKNSDYLDDEGNRLSENLDTNGRFHTNWLNMIYPRLKISRDLLKDDGVIFISIDDNELNNLITICNEVFGEKNHLATLIWNKQHSQQQGVFKRYHESVLVYAKNSSFISNISGGEGIIEAGAQKKISKANPASEFTFPAGVRFDAPDGTIITGTYGDSEKSTIVSGRLIAKDGKTLEPVTISAGWTQKNQMKDYFSGREVYDSKGQKVTSFYFTSTGKIKCTKDRSKITPSTLLPEYGMVSEQTKHLTELLGGSYFDNPKPVNMIYDFISWFADDEDIVLDFFSGSGTTAESVYKYNSLNNKNVRYILVQVNDKVSVNSEAKKNGYEYITEIAIDRIRKAADFIKNEELMNSEDVGLFENNDKVARDYGFRLFKLDSSNMNDVYYNAKSTTQSLFDSTVDNVKSDRTPLDLLFQVMLELGIELSAKIEEKEISGKKYFVVNENDIVACFDSNVNNDVIKELAQIKPIYAVFRDSVFESDSANINCEQLFKTISPSTIIKVL